MNLKTGFQRHEIEKTEKEVKKKEIDKQIQAKDYDYKLNKKFDESRIIDDKQN